MNAVNIIGNKHEGNSTIQSTAPANLNNTPVAVGASAAPKASSAGPSNTLVSVNPLLAYSAENRAKLSSLAENVRTTLSDLALKIEKPFFLRALMPELRRKFDIFEIGIIGIVIACFGLLLKGPSEIPTHPFYGISYILFFLATALFVLQVVLVCGEFKPAYDNFRISGNVMTKDVANSIFNVAGVKEFNNALQEYTKYLESMGFSLKITSNDRVFHNLRGDVAEQVLEDYKENIESMLEDVENFCKKIFPIIDNIVVA